MRVRSGQAAFVAAIAMISFFTPRAMSALDDDGPKLAQQVRSILERNCYRCHGQNGANEGGFDYLLDFTKLVGKKVIAGEPGKSRLLVKVERREKRDMQFRIRHYIDGHGRSVVRSEGFTKDTVDTRSR